MEYTIQNVIDKLPKTSLPSILAPKYTGNSSKGIGLAVESMKDHMTNEGAQIFWGLERSGYQLAGYNLPINSTLVYQIIEDHKPGIVVVQDKREWDVSSENFREPKARFHSLDYLKQVPNVFSVAILKDAHQRPDYHRDAAIEQNAHAWIIYYHPRIVKHLAPYVRAEHLIRTYHSLDKVAIPEYTSDRDGCILSGAISGAYPFRQQLANDIRHLPKTIHLRHPGYHRDGSCTPWFLRELTKYKVSICTASKYGYALRKIMESTACGCRVITDLPVDEALPEIDGNLVRVPPNTSSQEIGRLVEKLIQDYNPDIQKEYSDKAIAFYDYRESGKRLVRDIESLRSKYND